MPRTNRFISYFVVFVCSAVATGAFGANNTSGGSRFYFKDAHGRAHSAEIIDRYQPKKIVHPLAKIDPRINPKLQQAATIAQERAHSHSHSRCWQYVKEALLAAGVIHSYPKTVYAKEAGQELVNSYGFKKISVRDPFKAPVGAVLVYGARSAAGHVEIRTKNGFVSDFRSPIPSPRPLLGVYTKS